MSTIERLAKIKNVNELLEQPSVLEAALVGELDFADSVKTTAKILETMDPDSDWIKSPEAA